MRRLFVLVVASTLLVASTDPQINPIAVANFNKPYIEFFRHYYGCGEEPKEPRDLMALVPTICYPAVSYTDLESFRKAREAAKTLFGLH